MSTTDSTQVPKVCLVNFADGKFTVGQERLKRTLADIGYEGGTLFANELPAGCPDHTESPWGFKPFLMEQAADLGYDILIWVDAAIMARASLEPLIQRILEKQIFFFSRGISSMGAWTSDYALEELGFTREEAFKIRDVITIVIGIDIRSPKGKVFLNEWKLAAMHKKVLLGVDKPLTLTDSYWNTYGQLSNDPRVKGHRHDQPLLSMLAHVLHIKPNDDLVFDIKSEAKGGNKYSKHIPLNTVLVENRDFKISPTDMMNDFSAYKTSYASIIFTLVRKTKDLIRSTILYFVRKPETAVMLMSPKRILYRLKNKPTFDDIKSRPV
jgi:hypothetical protein